MLVIRLRRGGKKHEAHYRIVVQEQRSKLGGKYIESLGHYHPIMPNKPVEINKERVDFWLKSGAQMSVTVNNLFVKNGILPKDQKISKVYSKKKKTTAESAAKPAKTETTSKEEGKEESKEDENVTAEQPKESEQADVTEDKTDTKDAPESSEKSEINEPAKVDEVVEESKEQS